VTEPSADGPVVPDTLEAFADLSWRLLGRGVSDRRSPFHTPVLATIGRDGWPRARTLVLRGADRANGRLRLHTDSRSGKVAELTREPRASLHFYDKGARFQLRLEGAARLVSAGEPADSAWAAATLFARRCYLAPVAPGAASDGPTSGLPAALERREPDRAESEAGRPNFAVILLDAARLEFLHLAVTGHRRGLLSRTPDGDWLGHWLVP